MTAIVGVPALWDLLRRRLFQRFDDKSAGALGGFMRLLAKANFELRNRAGFDVGQLLFLPVREQGLADAFATSSAAARRCLPRCWRRSRAWASPSSEEGEAHARERLQHLGRQRRAAADEVANASAEPLVKGWQLADVEAGPVAQLEVRLREQAGEPPSTADLSSKRATAQQVPQRGEAIFGGHAAALEGRRGIASPVSSGRYVISRRRHQEQSFERVAQRQHGDSVGDAELRRIFDSSDTMKVKLR